ncbi:MAG: c-type cytochrome [Verrucomicrobiota bacterium]
MTMMRGRWWSRGAVVVLGMMGAMAGWAEEAGEAGVTGGVVPQTEAYESWRLASDGEAATSAVEIWALPGFEVELLRSAGEGEGSWVGLGFDDAGRLLVGIEERGILRMTLGGSEVSEVELVDDTLEECRSLLWAHGRLYANANRSSGFYRLKENREGEFETERLLETGGGMGHGRNHLRESPDGEIYLVHGNNVEVAPERLAADTPYRNYGEDQLIPCPWDDSWNKLRVPAGHVLRTGKNGKRYEMVSGGLRNPLDGDFNRDGEFFVYDADSEWDSGLPWYRPTRVVHVVSGGEFGWRRGTGKWPAYYEDSLPSVLDIGLGSPTGVGFGYGSEFPEKYREAFFIADWAYGRIMAVHLEPEGASYRGEAETFLSGRPLNVTDFVFGPDGAMYFVTGGRRTQSGLYRVRYVGEDGVESDAEGDDGIDDAVLAAAGEARERRRFLERFHARDATWDAASAVEAIWPHLEDEDRWIRYAARVALERQDVAAWRERALGGESMSAMMALARVGDGGSRGELVSWLLARDWEGMGEADRLRWLRTLGLAFIRMGEPTPSERAACVGWLDGKYPAVEGLVNHELCEVLVYLGSGEVLDKTLDLMDEAEATEDLVQYLFYARYVTEGWSAEKRRRYLENLRRAERFAGGRWYVRAMGHLREEAVAALSEEERLELAGLLEPEAPMAAVPLVDVSGMGFVKDWGMGDFAEELREGLGGRSYAAGTRAYEATGCAVCHKMAGNEVSLRSVLGPDLSALGSRFGLGAMLESIVAPSRVISDIYRNPAAPNVSAMPAGLINGLDREAVLDLLAYLQAGGDEGHAVFSSGQTAGRD